MAPHNVCCGCRFGWSCFALLLAKVRPWALTMWQIDASYRSAVTLWRHIVVASQVAHVSWWEAENARMKPGRCVCVCLSCFLPLSQSQWSDRMRWWSQTHSRPPQLALWHRSHTMGGLEADYSSHYNSYFIKWLQFRTTCNLQGLNVRRDQTAFLLWSRPHKRQSSISTLH